MNYDITRLINYSRISTKYLAIIFLFYFNIFLSFLEADNFFIGANRMSMQATAYLTKDTIKSSGDTYELNFGYLWDVHKSNKISLFNGLIGNMQSNNTYPVYIGYIQGSYYFSLADQNFLLVGLNFPYMFDSIDPARRKYTWNGDLGYEVGFSHLWNNWLISFGYKYFSGNLHYYNTYNAYTFPGWQISGFYLLP